MRAKTRTKLAIRDALLLCLTTTAKQRGKYDELIDGPAGLEYEWQVRERRAMLAAVNVNRADFGLPPVDEATVAKVERQAAGHVDYGEKCALYCAELAVGESWAEPR